jgi:hypothetical protein
MYEYVHKFNQLRTPNLCPNYAPQNNHFCTVATGLFLVQLSRLQCILHPLHLRRWPNTRDNLPVDQSHRNRSIIPRIPRPGQVVSAEIHMAFGYLSTQHPISKLPVTSNTHPHQIPTCIISRLVPTSVLNGRSLQTKSPGIPSTLFAPLTPRKVGW